jgi:signal transduction histidine kinase/CheY-like chemotaxis protein
LRRLFLRRSVPYGLFILAAGLSVAASSYLSWSAAATAEARARAEFLTDAQQTRRQIQAGLNMYFEVVRAGAVLLSADNEIQGAEFRRFVSGLRLRERYPGIEGIGFAPCVPRRELRSLLRTVDLDGSRVRIWPAGVRTEHCPTIFLEPMDSRNRAAVGFDLASEPLLQEAMARARDRGEPEASRKVGELQVRSKGWRGNFVLFIPIYRVARPLGSVEARRRALVGFVFSPFQSERLLQDIVASTTPSMAFEVYDGSMATPGSLLSASDTVAVPGRYQASELVQVTGREWLVTMTSVGEPVSMIPEAARQTLLGGVVLSFMLFLVTRAQARAWETAARHEAELRASAQALRESESQAQAANRAKDEFLATLSHELRTPLNVVLGWVSMLRLGTVREERRAHALEMIERNARQQAELIEDLLDVSRIVTGKLRLQLRPVPLAPIVSAVVESLGPSAEAKGVVLSAPTPPEAATLRGDADRLHQIAWNLVANAIKFTPAGGRVSVNLTQDESHVTLTVSDTGIGIPEEFLPKMFERFRQADSSSTRAHGGVGLGLAIVRHLVKLHGGTIDAQSAGRGQGATFVVKFPLAGLTAAPSTLPLVASAPLPTPRLHGVHVLVVDDDPHTRELLTEALGTTGARVTSAESARHALERLTTDGADVIVSDIAMPDEDGIWLMQRIRSLPGDAGRIPAIALSALARSEDRARAIAAGYQMHLAKPVQLGELQAGVATLIADSDQAPNEASV